MERAGLRGAPTLLKHLSKVGSLNERIATVTLPTGQQISFPAYDAYWCRYLYANAPYESDVAALFRRFGKGRVLVDCGANIGYWSARHRDFGFTRAIAIEPNPKLLRFLRMNFSGEIRDEAVYSVSGETLMFSGDGAQGHVGEGHIGVVGTPYPVRSLALKDLEIDGPALVKLDVEGAEIPAIEGAAGMDAIFVVEDFPTRGARVMHYLLERDFKLFAYVGGAIVPVKSAKDLPDVRNIDCCPVNIAAVRSP